METIIKAGNLIDSIGAASRKDVIITVSEGRISGVHQGSSFHMPADAMVIDLGDHTVLPGLIDAHMHFFGVDTMALDAMVTESEGYRVIRSVRDAYRLLEAGFTAVRCLGSSVSPILARGVDEGLVPGPRIMAAGNFVCPSGGTWDHIWLPPELMKEADMIADGIPECQAIVRRRLRQGANVIKVGTSMGTFHGENHAWGDSPEPEDQLLAYSVEELRAIVEEAHRLSVKVSSHSIGDAGVRHALDGGIDVIEHGQGMSDETRRRLADSGKILIPTLSHMHFSKAVGGYLGASQRSVEIAQRHIDAQIENFQRCLELGIRMAVGSDLIGPPWAPHGEQAAELELMVKYGMTPMDAIVAATRFGSEALGLEADIGAVELGKCADLIGVRGDPLQDISLLSNIDFVMKQGTVFRQDGVTHPEAWLSNPPERMIDVAGGI